MTDGLIDQLSINLCTSSVGHLCDIETSKIQALCSFWLEDVPRATAACHSSTSLFWRFDLEMRFASQRREIFWHPNFKEWPGTVSFLEFGLESTLCATAVCNFSFLCWTATSAPAASASLLFDPPEQRIVEKAQRPATFLTFRACISSF